MASAASATKAKKNARRKARGHEQARPSRSAAPTAIPAAMRRAIPPGGRSLPGDVRTLMESRFNTDFSRVTVHEGAPAQGYAAGRDANAYALGEHIVFDQGRYAPHSAQGQRLLAHELAHVVQQRRGGAMPSPGGDPVLEAHADRAADAISGVGAAGVGVQVGGASAAGMMCDRTGRKKKRNGVDYDDDEQFDSDDDTEQARRKSEKQRTQQEKRDRRTAGQSHAQIGSDEAERDLRRMEDHARKPGGNQRSQKRRDRKLKRFERKLESARGSQLDKNKRKGDFDERQRTPSSVGVTPQTDFVAGSKVLPGQQVRDEDDNSIAHHTRPDFSVIKRRKDGTWERVHFNLKSNQIDRMTESEARAAAREILYQAVKNKAHLPGEERLIISFAHAPSKELQEAIKEELFREHTPISEIRFGNVVHRNADYKPEKGRIPLDVNAKDRRRRLAAEAKRAKAKEAADARAAKRKKAADAKAAKAKKAAEARAAKQKKAADAKAAKQKKAADAKAAKAKKAAEAKAAKAKKAAEAKAAKKQAADAKAAQKKEAADTRAAKKAATADAKKSPAKKPSAKKAATTGAKKAPAKKSAAKKATNKTARKATPASKSTKKSEAAKSKPAQSTAGKKAVAAPRAAKPKQRIRIATEAASPPGATANTESGQQRVRIASPRVRIANPNDAAERDAEALREAQAEQEADDALAGGKKKAPKALAKPQSTAQTAPSEKQEPAAKKSPTKAAPAEQKATKKPPAKPPTQVQPPPPAQTKAAPKKVPPPASVNVAKKASPAPQPPPTTQTSPPPQTAPVKPQQKRTPAPGKPPGPGNKGLNTTGTAQTKTFFNDQVQVSVQEKVGAAKPFHVTTAITLRGGGSIGGQANRGSSGASGNLSASGSLSISYSKWMTEQEKNQYLASVATGHGAGHAESTIIELIASNQQDAAGEAIKKAKARMGDRQQGEAGDTEEISVEGDVSAGAGASRGRVGGNVEISSGKGIRRTRTLMEDGRELYTVTVTLRSGQSIGGTVQSGVASGGYNDARDETRTVYYSFLLDPDAGDYSARKSEILAATSVEELKDLAQKHRDLAYGSGQSQAKGNVGTTSAGVLGFGIDIDQSSFYEEGEGQDPTGKQRHVRGGAGIGGSVTILGRRVNPSSKTDSFTGWVDENNVGGGVTQSENREVDWQKTAGGLADAASHPVASAVAIAKGKPILQERVDSVGVNLSDDSFTRIAELAKDEKAWFRAWTGKGVSRGSKDDWEAARQQVLAANGDRYKIQQAMAKWEKGDSGRSAEVENLTGGTGVSFDFPDEILDQKPVYDQLVMGDLLAGPRQLVAEGKTSEAVSQLEGLNKRLGQLLQTVQMHSGQSTDPGKFAEVQSRIAARQKQLRQEIYRLTAPSTKAATKAGEPPPEPVAAPPPDFVGPLSVDQEEAVKAERKEASETIHTQVGVCLVNRDVENKAFAEVVDELDDFYIDRAFIFNKLNSLKPMYTKWDAAIAELKAAYPKIGDPPDRANQFAPNRDRWNALNSQALK